MSTDLSGECNRFPGFDRIYKLKKSYESDCFYADPHDISNQAELLRGEWIPESPLGVYWAMGRPVPSDIAIGRSTAWFYLSSRVQKLFMDNEFLGWSTYPIVLHDQTGEACAGYVGFSITGRCGPIKQQGGEVFPGQRPGKKFVRRIGLYFDDSTWDGSDLFCPAGENNYIFVTERVKDLFEKIAIEGFEFTPLAEATWYPQVC